MKNLLRRIFGAPALEARVAGLEKTVANQQTAINLLLGFQELEVSEVPAVPARPILRPVKKA